jgi:hypothetical protein
LIGFDSFLQSGKPSTRKVMKAFTLYVLTTASLLITYFISFKAMPVNFLVDAPLMNGIAMIIFILVPGLNRGLLED